MKLSPAAQEQILGAVDAYAVAIRHDFRQAWVHEVGAQARLRAEAGRHDAYQVIIDVLASDLPDGPVAEEPR